MKKIFLTSAFVFMLASSLYADGEPAHIIFGNVINISGGNDSVFIQTDDYLPSDRTTASSVTVLDSVWSSRPVMFGSIPSERNALMNSGQPVDIIARGDKLSIMNWGGDGLYSIRLLDSNGSQILKDTLRTRQPDIKVSLTPEYKYYYLEFTESEVNYDYDSENGYFPSVSSSGNEIRYCYVLLRMKSMNAEPERESRTEARPVESNRESNSASEAISDIYHQLRNKAVNDNMLRMENDSAENTQTHDEAIRLRETETQTLHESNEYEEEDTNMIPARRIKIKHNTEYETESKSESE